jgi:DNA-directed RNA polymerase subunit RPC12/RpoP
VIPAAAAYTSRCRTCGREISPDAASCPHCGAANMEERCPHCGAVTTASPDKELRWRCDLCGGPRLPRPDPAVPRPRRELPHLKKAETARKTRAKSRALAAAFTVMGAGTTLFFALWALVFGASLGLAVLGVLAGSALFVVLWALGRAGNATKEMKAAVDQAWLAAADAVAARMKGPFTAATLARALGVDNTHAEELLAHLEAHDAVRSDVTDAGEIAYQSRLRIGDVDTSSPEAETEALAEAEAMAAEERRAKAGR